ncbi:sulfite exporter TauE/SafE family protein [Flavobacterium amnicola]|uniref:Probable membrane transporter protein n=1 Tax=Flavobacterium amnicola TaxID=2506422 RepID=A0A4Q1K4D7_9FLAO|nr:sulfite exporter TauE/SafE family protein [Flavobacterium amnicola]RXR20427.1 sulfite exporter TauE/SafE family protein [Flavobacterium amnicola]
MEFLIYFILLALLAEIVGTVGGFGSSLLFVPIASYFFDFHSVLGITALYHLSSNISKIYFFRKGYDKKLILYIGIPAVLFVVIGAFLSKYINAAVLEILLSLFLICISLLFILKENINFKPSNRNSIIGGTFSGLLAGLLGTGGAIRGLTLAAYNLKPEVFIATSAIIDLGIDLSRTVVYGMNGYLHKDDLYLIPILFVVSIVGTFIGKKIVLKIPEQQFKKIVLILIFITGVSTLLKVIL